MREEQMRTIRDLDPAGKRILVRVDFNVPLSGGEVADDSRIRAALPTIRDLLGRGGALALCSHLGRPKGEDRTLSLAPVARRLSALIGRDVPLAPDCVGPQVEAMVSRLRSGDRLLLENVRFHPEEEANDPEFARRLAAPFDAFVNDAFGAAHRAHASTEGVTKYLPAYAGSLLEREVSVLTGLLRSPERPFVAIVGGAKVSTKIDVLRALADKVDALAVGGGMANTFLSATGHAVGKSLREPDREDEARAILDAARRRGVQVILPVDVVCAPSADEAGAAGAVVRRADEVKAEEAIVDAGPGTLEAIGRAVAHARTVFWNGPLGIFEVRRFAAGTRRVAELLASSKATTVVGGGESVQAIEELGLVGKMTHVSTGGGAALELIEGRTLPGVAAIPGSRDATPAAAGGPRA